jgi:MATE family multidrug resistance protein
MSEAPKLPTTLKTLLLLAWPIVISRASQTIIGLSDVLLVAKLGPSAVAATATGAANALMLLILPMGIVFIVQSYAAQYRGQNDLVSARRYGWYGLLIAAVTQVAAFGSLLVVGPLLGLLPYDPEVRVLMTGYLSIRLLSGGAAIGIEALASYFGGLGRTWPGMVANLLAMTLNVVLNVVLINGHLGFHAMGVLGSAWASSLATGAAFVGFFAYFVREGRLLAKSKLAWSELRRMLRFGLPSGLNWLFEFLAYLFFVNIVVGGLGTLPLAAWNSVLALNSAAFMPAFGLASAGAVLVGQAIGAGNKDEVPHAAKLTFLASCVWQALVGALYLSIPSVLISPFAQGESSAEFISLGVRMLMVSTAWQLFDAAVSTFAETLRAAGDTLFPLVARLLIAWCIFVPGSLLSVRVFHVGEVGAAAWLVVYMGLLAVVLVWRFRRGTWRTMQLTELPAPP